MPNAIAPWVRALALISIPLAGLTVAALKNQTDGMVLIHAATFRMGIDAAEIPRYQRIFHIDHALLFNAELPSHPATIAGFYLDSHLVTNAQF